MAILNRRRQSALPWLAGALLSFAGCAILGALEAEDHPFAFSHRLHVGDQGLECIACHAQAPNADAPGMPGPGGCALCHAEIDAPKPPERQIAALFDGKAYKARHVMAVGGDVRFAHAKHAERAEDCNACHADLAQSDRTTPEHALSMDECSACHAAKGAPNECATCHEKIRSDAKPPSHVASWRRSHGAVFRACDREDTASRCDLCHTESSCSTCHLAEAPENHKGYWRDRGHGLAASMDRQNCAACHQPDACDRCHQENAPRNHVGGFGAPLDRHCLTCHEPVRDETCITCHAGTPSHALATPMPSWHLPSMNCRQCHGNGQPLPHVDDGSTCTHCHL